MFSSCEIKALSQRQAETLGFELLTSTETSEEGEEREGLGLCPKGFAQAVRWKLARPGDID